MVDLCSHQAGVTLDVMQNTSECQFENTAYARSSRYRFGCRCDDCRAAKAAARRLAGVRVACAEPGCESDAPVYVGWCRRHERRAVSNYKNPTADWAARFRQVGLTLLEPYKGQQDERHLAGCDLCGNTYRVTANSIYKRIQNGVTYKGCKSCCWSESGTAQGGGGYAHVEAMDYKQIRKAALAAVERDPLVDSRDEQIRRWEGLPCGVCGEPIDYTLPYPPYNSERMEADHIVPLSAGGAHTWANLQPAHAICNRSKRSSWEDGIGEFAVVDGVLTPRKREPKPEPEPMHGPVATNHVHDLDVIGYAQHCYLEPGTSEKRPYSERPKLRELAADCGVPPGTVGCWVNFGLYDDFRHVYYAICAVDEEVLYV